MKALVGAFNQEKALVGAFSVIVQLHRLIVYSTIPDDEAAVDGDGVPVAAGPLPDDVLDAVPGALAHVGQDPPAPHPAHGRARAAAHLNTPDHDFAGEMLVVGARAFNETLQTVGKDP